jgi:hypothetical protein
LAVTAEPHDPFGKTMQLHIQGDFGENKEELTAGLTYTSQPEGQLSVDGHGLVTVTGHGVVKIIVKQGDVEGNVDVALPGEIAFSPDSSQTANVGDTVTIASQDAVRTCYSLDSSAPSCKKDGCLTGADQHATPAVLSDSLSISAIACGPFTASAVATIAYGSGAVVASPVGDASPPAPDGSEPAVNSSSPITQSAPPAPNGCSVQCVSKRAGKCGSQAKLEDGAVLENPCVEGTCLPEEAITCNGDKAIEITCDAGVYKAIVFANDPIVARAGVVFSPQPVIHLVDSTGKVAIGAAGTVTLSVKADAALNGNPTLTVTEGVADFQANGLKVDVAGTYELTAAVANEGPIGLYDT